MTDERAAHTRTEGDIPRPDYGATAPSDWVGSRAVKIMLEDLEFPRTVGQLRERAGNWRVPARSPIDMVPLSRLLEGMEDDTQLRSAEDVARRIRKRHHAF